MKQPKFYWHIHHDVLLEPLTEPIKNRIKSIKHNKPPEEIELRLKLLKFVKGKLPQELIETGQEYYKIERECERVRRNCFIQESDKINQKYIKIEKKYWKVIQKYLPQLKILHEKECGCGYDFNKNTIFTKKNGFKK